MKVTLKTLENLEKSGTEGQLIARGFYKTIFDRVASPGDWKGPINITLEQRIWEDFDAEKDTIRHAIMFFTGNPDCKVSISKGYMSITSAGYRAGPCGG